MFENVVRKMLPISSRPQCVKSMGKVGCYLTTTKGSNARILRIILQIYCAGRHPCVCVRTCTRACASVLLHVSGVVFNQKHWITIQKYKHSFKQKHGNIHLNVTHNKSKYTFSFQNVIYKYTFMIDNKSIATKMIEMCLVPLGTNPLQQPMLKNIIIAIYPLLCTYVHTQLSPML